MKNESLAERPNLSAVELVRPWQQQRGETDLSYKLFRSYLNQTAPRNYRITAESNGRTETAIQMHAKKGGWIARAAAWDLEINRRADESVLEDAATIRKEHLRALRIMREKGMELIEATESGDGRAMLVDAVKLERLIMGEATERAEVGQIRPNLDALTVDELQAYKDLLQKMNDA